MHIFTVCVGSSNTLTSCFGGGGGGMMAGTPPTGPALPFSAATGPDSTGTHSLSLCWLPLDTGNCSLRVALFASLSWGVTNGSCLEFYHKQKRVNMFIQSHSYKAYQHQWSL